MDRRIVDVALTSAMLVAALAILTMDGFVSGGVEAELDAMFLPRVVAALIGVFSLMICLPSLMGLLARRPADPEAWIKTDGLGGVLAYLAIFFTYWWVMPIVGFLVATPVVIFAISVLLNGRNWIAMAAVSVITPTLIFYACQNFLRVYLPGWSL